MSPPKNLQNCFADSDPLFIPPADEFYAIFFFENNKFIYINICYNNYYDIIIIINS